MAQPQIRLGDGAAYEHMMGVWSCLVGEAFLDWLAPAPGLRWLDVGCGNGAFTELLVERCTPGFVQGIDPSDGQLAFARARHRAGVADFRQGSATDLPADGSFDAAVMALVLFFVPDPAQGVARMIRAVRPAGIVAAYVWDLFEPDGFPGAPLQNVMIELGFPPVLPPQPEVSRMDVLQSLWRDAGLTDIRTRAIAVQRTFASFDDFWATVEISLAMTQGPGGIAPEIVAEVKDRLRVRLPADSVGRITYISRANAITGRVR